MKQILTEWRKYIAEEDNLEQNIYSFDFDNTLIRYHTLEDGDVEYLGPHEANIQLLKDLAADGNKIIIVTSRSTPKRKFEWDKAPTPEEAVQEFGLPVSEIYYTRGEIKVNKLIELGVSKHWDDDEDEVEAAREAGIEATLVSVEEDVADKLKDKWLRHLEEIAKHIIKN
jgi:FMN phosphatase YigB (HAD superfamily)